MKNLLPSRKVSQTEDAFIPSIIEAKASSTPRSRLFRSFVQRVSNCPCELFPRLGVQARRVPADSEPLPRELRDDVEVDVEHRLVSCGPVVLEDVVRGRARRLHYCPAETRQRPAG